jgi:AraC family transcriptional regulator
MAVAHDAAARYPAHSRAAETLAGRSLILPGVEVRREGRVEPFLHEHPTLSSADVRWSGFVLEDYSVPACMIPQHEHVEHFVHVVLRGAVKYEVRTVG